MRFISPLLLILLVGCKPVPAPETKQIQKAPIPTSVSPVCLDWQNETRLIGKMPYTMKVCKKWDR